MLPVMLRTLASEVDLRPRVVATGDVFVAVLVDAGEDGGSVLWLRQKLSAPDRNILWSEWRLSSKVDAGDAERGESRDDMPAVRLATGREVDVRGELSWPADSTGE